MNFSSKAPPPPFSHEKDCALSRPRPLPASHPPLAMKNSLYDLIRCKPPRAKEATDDAPVIMHSNPQL